MRYPGLPDDPAHKIAAQQMRRYGCVVSFTLPTRAVPSAFSRPCAWWRTRRASAEYGPPPNAAAAGGGDAVPEGFIRMSVGAEDPEDLVADVLRALDESAG
ncbi:PLP-dependent transferase [Streptomyces tricolor]|nr:PLP-dependent transferase [Streptomyces tricolor]